MTELRFEPVDFDRFHEEELPRRIAAGHGRLAARDLRGAAPLAFRLAGGASWTYVPGAETVDLVPGDAEAATVAELDAPAWSDYANELRTCFGLLYASQVSFPRGSFDDLARWEPAVRALFHGRPVYDADTAELPDPLVRSFALADDDWPGFFRQTGFVHLRGVFAPAEVDELVAEVERLVDAARPGDGRSWWATRADGDEVCCRVTYTTLASARIAALVDDDRIRRLAGLGPEGLVPTLDCLDGFAAVIKQPGAVEGLADLPWHQDCGLGGHPVICPGVQIGVQLDAATADAGQLRFLAGSQGTSCHQLQESAAARLPVVAVDTEPGDVTVHDPHVLHAAPPPTGSGPGRRALYASYVRPETVAYVGPGRGYNDVLFERDARVRSVDEVKAGR
ncbi:MAG TPA: phytanoyl-CoA dioxygenase family protein [Acidimicrobiia bacterium]|nr:phytanoyl-CoA dioxygenase family protein [Acidimicrobiia bacterium]